MKKKDTARKGGRRAGDSGRANGASGRRRANNTGTLEKRGTKWLARWYIYDAQGRRIRKSQMIDASGIDGAREELRKLTEGNALMTREKEIRRNLDALDGVAAERRAWEDAQPSYTLTEAWDAFDAATESQKRDPATQRNYGQWYGIFSEWLKTNHPEIKELRRVDSRTAREYAAHLVARVRGTTFNRHFNALALIWASLAARDADGKAVYPDARLGANPFSWDKRTKTGIERIKLCKGDKPHRRRDLNLEEVAAIFKAAQGEMRVLLALGFYTGLRLGDCATLEWANIDRVNGVITRYSNKTDTQTETRINPALARIIEEAVPTDERTGYLLPSLAALYNGGTTGRVKLVRMIAEVFNAAGIKTSYKAEGDTRARPDCGFHSLRHTFVTQLERLGATIAERQRLAGHRTAAMTAHYTHDDSSRVLALPDLTDGQTIDADAPASHAGRTDGADGATMPTGAAARLEAFKAAFRALTGEERKTAAEWMANQQGEDK